MLARAARGGCRCGLVGSIVLRATFSPAAAQLQLLVVRLLAAFFVLHICGATGHCWPHAAVLAAGLCWSLDVMDCSIVMSETQSSLLGAKLSGNFQQKMSAEYDWMRSSAAREFAVETHQKH